MTLKELIENKSTLDYQQICTLLIQTFCVDEKVNWESVLPAQQQREYFGAELKLIADHPILSQQQDIRPIALKKGTTSQMLFFYVCLNDATLPKKQIQDVTKKFITGGDANRYIIWFFGNEKKTALKVVLSAKEGKKVVLKTLPFGVEQPFYKTYTYILEKVNAEVNQLFVEPTDLWKALWKAFDISVINTKFYNEIRDAFNDLIEQLNKKGTPFTNEEDKVKFAIRLIGRIIFCWFLKRKGVLHDAAISSEAVNTHSHKNYYHEILEPLFFDVLNTPENERKGGLLKIIAHYPFLNGGLFEAQDSDYKQNALLNIDNDWFYTLYSKTLEKYNFTVDENSSSSAEIAIDPEMLGRIFENLLAEQNPETGDSARKATGSFYTPREIVDYMVEQSISEYLKTYLEGSTERKNELKENLFGVIPNQQLSLPKTEKLHLYSNWQQDIEDFVHIQILPTALTQYEDKLTDALNTIKVLDPACGSGAFPIGVLQKIVALKHQLHPKAKNYKLKLDTIQNSIYGVDIQPMAVELSRLRCWLSLVVDEDPKDIKALPNLDFKFVCADSLVSVPDDNYVKNLSAMHLERFAKAVNQYFNPDFKKKNQLKKDIKDSLHEITKTHDLAIKQVVDQIRKEQKSSPVSRLKRLNESLIDYTNKQRIWHSYGNIFKNKKVDFFDVKYFFPSAENGFDIVIGNPPYGHTIKENKEYFQTNFISAEGKHEIFKYFIERGLRLLKEDGVLSYITSDTWTSLGYFKKLRELIYTNYKLIAVSKTLYNVFETATVDTNIYFIKNTPLNSSNYFLIDGDLKSKIAMSFEMNDEFVFNLKDKNNIIRGIENGCMVLDEFCEIWQGLIAYGKKEQEREYTSEKKETTNHRKLLYGGDISKYGIIWSGEYLNYGNWLHRPRPSYIFDKPKILVQRIRNPKLKTRLVCALDIDGFLNGTGLSNILLKEDIKTPTLKFLLAILNSKLINYWFSYYFIDVNIKPEQLRKIPIALTNNSTSFETIVEMISELKQIKNPNAIHESVSITLLLKQLEEIIDGMVLELYFGEEMKTKKVNIIELVQKELEKTTSKDTTESIYKFYKSVSHPDSEIHNRILSFAIVSPDILKPILQG